MSVDADILIAANQVLDTELAVIAGKVDNGGPDTVFIDGVVYVKASSINYLLHERATVFALLLLAGVLAGFVAGLWVML